MFNISEVDISRRNAEDNTYKESLQQGHLDFQEYNISDVQGCPQIYFYAERRTDILWRWEIPMRHRWRSILLEGLWLRYYDVRGDSIVLCITGCFRYGR